MILKAGITTPATSAWSFLLVTASKKYVKARFFVDYRTLRQKTKADRFLLPRNQELFDELAGSVLITTLDFFSRYWQIKMSEHCKEKTTFVCRFGTFQFEGMPLELVNAPSTFQRMMDGLLGSLSFARLYLDDVVIFSASMEEHMEHIKKVISRVAGHEKKIKVSKCDFVKEQGGLPIHVVDQYFVRVIRRKTDVIQNTPLPTVQTKLRNFLGNAG